MPLSKLCSISGYWLDAMQLDYEEIKVMLSTRLLVFSRPNEMKYDFRPFVRAARDSDQNCLSYPLNKRRTWEKNRSRLLFQMDLLKDLQMNASLSKTLYSLLLNPWRNSGPANQMRNFPHKFFSG
jgi:hypothetical protein